MVKGENTLEAARNDIHVREMDSVRVKGKREPVTIYELLGKGQPGAEAQPEGESPARVIECQHKVAGTVDQRQYDDGAKLAQQTIGKQRAQQRGQQLAARAGQAGIFQRLKLSRSSSFFRLK